MTHEAKTARATLIGQAVGDALGVPVEFLSRETVRAIDLRDMLGCDTPKSFESRWGDRIPAGAWSDDTSMAVAAMASIVNNSGRIDPEDIMTQFSRWWHSGLYCAVRHPFGLGSTVRIALQNFVDGYPAAKCGASERQNNGNGALMRIHPFSLYCIFKRLSIPETIQTIDIASGITHGHEISKISCVVFTLFLGELLTGKPVADAWENVRRFDYSRYYGSEAVEAHARLFADDFVDTAESAIGETGYVVDTLMTAVYSMLTCVDYEGSVLRAIGMGYDTDTAGAVTGALAGAYYGIEAIPQRWLTPLKKLAELTKLADNFAAAVVGA